MYRVYVLVLFLLFAPFARAQDLGPSQTIPPNGVLRGSFVEDHYFKNAGKPFHSEGRFMVAPDQGILWMVEKPFPLTLAFTSQGMTQFIGGMPLLHVSNARIPLLTRLTGLINSIMSSQWEALQSDFVVSHTPVDQGWRTNLKPRSEKSGLPFKALTLTGGSFIDSARAMRKDEGLEVFTFSNQAISNEPPTKAEMAALTNNKTAH